MTDQPENLPEQEPTAVELLAAAGLIKPLVLPDLPEGIEAFIFITPEELLND